MNVVITNRDEHEFDFTFLLHTYFSVPNIEHCVITGLKGCNYIDKVKGGVKTVDENEILKIKEFVDRVYLNTMSVIKLSPISPSRHVAVIKENLPDTVVWNPWEENAKKMSDFGDEEYRRMVCVEAGHVATPYTLISGDSFRATHSLKVL